MLHTSMHISTHQRPWGALPKRRPLCGQASTGDPLQSSIQRRIEWYLHSASYVRGGVRWMPWSEDSGCADTCFAQPHNSPWLAAPPRTPSASRFDQWSTCLTYTTLHAPHHHSKKRRALRQDRGTRQRNEPRPHQHHHYDSHGDAHLETRRHRLRGCPVASLVDIRA